MTKIRIAIFASGSGSNAENIYNYFADNTEVEISLILTNNPNAYVLERAKKINVPSWVFDKTAFKDTDQVVQKLKDEKIDLVILAGFLWLIPHNLIQAFPNKIINIHPALLPKYGGKGMYGDNVHKAVKANEEKETGITIHLVNEKYDEGEILAQYSTALDPSDSPEDIAKKVHTLEYEHFPKEIEKIALSLR